MEENQNILTRRNLIYLVIGALVSATLIYKLSGPWLIRPLYSAESVFYVPLTIPAKQIEQQGIGFASDREIDGHIQIMKSGILRDSLIERFHLDEAMDMDLETPGERSRLYKIIDKRLKIEKTRYSSVAVSFRDEDPERTADIVNAAVSLGDDIKEALLLANRQDALDYSTTLYEGKVAEVARMESRIDSLERLDGPSGKANATVLSKLRTMYDIEIQELAGRKNHLERAQKSFETELPRVYVLSYATADYSPVYPRRLLLALAGAFIFSVIFITYLVARRDAASA